MTLTVPQSLSALFFWPWSSYLSTREHKVANLQHQHQPSLTSHTMTMLIKTKNQVISSIQTCYLSTRTTTGTSLLTQSIYNLGNGVRVCPSALTLTRTTRTTGLTTAEDGRWPAMVDASNRTLSIRFPRPMQRTSKCWKLCCSNVFCQTTSCIHRIHQKTYEFSLGRCFWIQPNISDDTRKRWWKVSFLHTFSSL